MSPRTDGPNLRRRPASGLAGVGAALLLVTPVACSRSGADSPPGGTTSVFDVAVGTCAQAPRVPKAEVTTIEVVDCATPHDLEAYAQPQYQATDPAATDPAEFPGQRELDSFAQGACAQEFEAYVGQSYADSDLQFTYLLPSARSWEDPGRRYVLCFLRSAERSIQGSLKDSAGGGS